MRRDSGHVAALLIEPLGVAAFRDAVADERQPRRAEREQLVRVHREIGRCLSPEGGFLRSVLEKAARHPVILARAGQILNRLAEISPVQLGPSLPGRTDQHHGKSLVVRHGDECRLAEARYSFDPDFFLVDCLVGHEVIEAA